MNTPITMISAHILDANNVEVNYNRDVTAIAFTGGPFTSQSSGEIAAAINQGTAAQLLLVFAGDVSADDDLTYSGLVPNVVTPQTIDYT